MSSPLAFHRGWPLTPSEFLWADDWSLTLDLEQRLRDYGAAWSTAAPLAPTPRQQMDWTLVLPAYGPEREAASAWWRITRSGAQAWWAPHAARGELTAASGSTLTVRSSALDFAASLRPGGDLLLEGPDGTRAARRVTASEHLGGGLWLWALDAAPPAGVLATPAAWAVRTLGAWRMAGASRVRGGGEISVLSGRAVEIVRGLTDSGSLAAPAAEVWLYRITRTFNRTETWSLHLTSASFPIDAGGHIWLPAPIDHEELGHGGEGRLDRARLRIAGSSWPDHPFSSWLPRAPGAEWGLVVSRARLASPTDRTPYQIHVLFQGIISEARATGPEWVIEARHALDGGDALVPRLRVQPYCGHQLYEPNSCRANPATHRRSVTIEVIDSGRRTVEIAGADLPSAAALSGGSLVWGTPPETQTAAIFSATGTGSARLLSLATPLHPAALIDDVAYVLPGCDRTPGTCTSRFANFINYGGHPLVPGNNPTLKAVTVQNASGGRKK